MSTNIDTYAGGGGWRETGSGREWDSLAAWARDGADPQRTGRRDEPGEITERIEQARAEQAHAEAALPFPRTAADLDMDKLGEITARHGFAVFDPDAPGGFRELNGPERDRLDRETARQPDGHVVEYDPTAEPGDPAWREPLSDDEAAARTSWLADGYRAARETAEIEGRAWHPELEQRSEVDEALADAHLDADLSARAHDGDPDPARRVAALEALRDLRPTPPQPEHELGDEHGDEQGRDPGLALEDAWFRASLDAVVPAETPDRDAVLDRAVDHARTRFVDHGETTWPEQALAATRHHEPDLPDVPDVEASDVEVPEVDHDEPEA